MNDDNRVSCHELFKTLNILPLHSQHILFVVKNTGKVFPLQTRCGPEGG